MCYASRGLGSPSLEGNPYTCLKKSSKSSGPDVLVSSREVLCQHPASGLGPLVASLNRKERKKKVCLRLD